MHAPCQTSAPPPEPQEVPPPQRLRERLGLTPAALPASAAAQAQFPFKAPAAFLQRIAPADPDDPLLRQIWPAPQEELAVRGFVADPVDDAAAVAAPGLLQKYQGRALLIATGACAIHCRYCFRRHFPYHDHTVRAQAWAPALAQIAADETLREVILSGGDPLTLSTRRLEQLLERLAGIAHIERLRIHTRVPVVDPARVDAPLTALLARHPQPVVMVIHSNHPAELDDRARDTLLGLRACGVTLLNQSVLLSGVNDDVATLQTLHERLFDCGVLPYYLHQVDPVAGAAHFAVADDAARALIAALRERLPGYLVPRLVREVRGAPCKEPLGG